jgi:hypothetical protein
MSIITVSEAKDFLKLGSASNVDEEIQRLIDQVENYVDHLGIKLESGEIEEEFHSGGFSYLKPHRHPLSSVSSIYDIHEGQTVSSDYYSVRAGRIYYGENGIGYWDWPRGMNRYKVTYTAGYGSGEVPDGVKSAILHGVYKLYHEPQKISSTSAGVSSTPQLLYGDDFWATIAPHIDGADMLS